MVRVAVVGATGYAGRELITRLARHARVAGITAMSARADADPTPLDPLGERTVVPFDGALLAEQHDVVFTCLPHRLSATVVAGVLDANASALVVDLSADMRFRDATEYERVYGIEHAAPALCDAANYSVTELDRGSLAGTRLVANPGCYPTATLLALQPLVEAGVVRAGSRVVVDAKSGVSGAGKAPTDVTLYGNVNESCRAYGVGDHRHAPEIASRLGGQVAVSFVPHLLPMFRGMLATVYVEPADGHDVGTARDVLAARYADEPFVHVLDGQPRTADVSGTNACHLGIADVAGAIVVTSAIDNLVKGAAGQALQNMNAVLELPETEGLL